MESLIRDHPAEPEIAARARSYLQICRREETPRQRSAPTNDEIYSLGVLEHNRGNYDAAVGYFREAHQKRPAADYVLYSLAASLSLKGESAEAMANLRQAIDLNEDNRVFAKNDPDFSALHGHPEFAMLVGLDQLQSDESPSP